MTTTNTTDSHNTTNAQPNRSLQSLAKYLALILLSAILIPLSFPPYDIWPCILIAWFPLFLVARDATSRTTFYLAFLHGIIAYGFSLYWIYLIFQAAALPLYALLSLFSTLFFLIFNLTANKARSPIIKTLLAATLWTAIEFYRCEYFFLRFPWITPGTALGPSILTPIIGVYGTTFLVFSVSAALIYKQTRISAIILAVILAALTVFHPAPITPSPQNAITIAAVQLEEVPISQYIDLTNQIKHHNPKLIVWPEYAVPYDITRLPYNPKTLINLCKQHNATLILGTKTILNDNPRTWHNTALTIDSTGIRDKYYKHRPVHFFNDGLPGSAYNTITTDLGTFATPICFDCDYSLLARRLTISGAQFFAAPSFDSQSWSYTQHLQHAQLFRLRAAENARWFVVAASSGPSQIIDPNGNIHQYLPPMKQGSIVGSIEPLSRLTFYTRLGYLFPYLTIPASAILLLVLIFKKPRQTTSPAD